MRGVAVTVSDDPGKLGEETGLDAPEGQEGTGTTVAETMFREAVASVKEAESRGKPLFSS